MSPSSAEATQPGRLRENNDVLLPGIVPAAGQAGSRRKSPQTEFIQGELAHQMYFEWRRPEYEVATTRRFIKALAATPAYSRLSRTHRKMLAKVWGKYARPSTGFVVMKKHKDIAADFGWGVRTVERLFSEAQKAGLTDSHMTRKHYSYDKTRYAGKVTWIRPEVFTEKRDEHWDGGWKVAGRGGGLTRESSVEEGIESPLQVEEEENVLAPARDTYVHRVDEETGSPTGLPGGTSMGGASEFVPTAEQLAAHAVPQAFEPSLEQRIDAAQKEGDGMALARLGCFENVQPGPGWEWSPAVGRWLPTEPEHLEELTCPRS